MIDTISCKIFKLHNNEIILDNKDHLAYKCKTCGTYEILHKCYNIKSIYKQHEIPDKLKDRIENKFTTRV